MEAHDAVKVANTDVTGRLSIWREDLQRGAYADIEIPPEAWTQLHLRDLCERYVLPALASVRVRLNTPLTDKP